MWIDGKPIYRFVIHMDTVPEIQQLPNGLNIDTVIFIGGRGIDNNYQTHTVMPNIYLPDFYWGVFYEANGNTIKCKASNYVINAEYIIEYTKTTD